MLENLLVFLHPLVHFGPFESKMVFDRARARQWVQIAPRCVLFGFVSGSNRPVRRFTFLRTESIVLARREEILVRTSPLGK